jgi:hypothetical protein
MPYSRTQARIDALARIKSLQVPFVYAKVRTRSLPTHVRDAVFQNCVFQLCAALEDYLLEAMAGWLTNLLARGAAASALPATTRAIALLKHQDDAFRLYVGTKDEGRFAEAILADRSFAALLVDTETMQSSDLASMLVKDKKFPSTRNFEALFKRIGIDKIFGKLSARTASTFELNLRSFMDVRNALAHESPPSVTDEDLVRYFSQVRSWIDAIDRELYSHVVKVSGSAYW